MTDMNDLIRSMRDRGQMTVITSEPDSEVQRWTAELRDATEAKDSARMAFCDGKLTEALNGPEQTTSFSGGAHRAVEPAKTPSQQMTDLIRKRYRGA